MSLKIIGAILIIAVCGGFGYAMAAAHRSEEKAIRQMQAALDYMKCELQYHLTPLPDLCRQASKQAEGCVMGLLELLAGELENQISPDASCCMVAAIEKIPALPGRCTEAARMLGRSLGRFDTQGQLQGIEGVRQFCRRNLDELANGREQRLRNYQTLGLCTGAALVILFI
jgi:stage III sporulation protein AB